MKNISLCVLRTLIYADIFDYPLTKGQIHKRLHGKGKTRKNTEEVIDQLVSEDKLEKQGKFYFLPGREKIINLRRKRSKYSQKKLDKAKKVTKLISFIPTIKFVGVTGSVAAGNAEKKDDIDFFIIASSGWLWTTRFLVTVLLSLLGLRRWPSDKEVKDKICLNMFVDEAYLDVFSRNLFIAYELMQLKPIIIKDDIYQKLLAANEWVKKFLPNVKKLQNLENLGSGKSSRSRNLLDIILMKIQLWWMRKRKTTEITKPYLIAFHPKDISQEVLDKYQHRVEKLIIDK
jgi:predicted nucleotidyltransferase